MRGVTATYLSVTKFSLEGDRTAEFRLGQRLFAFCGDHGAKSVQIVSVNFNSSNTIIIVSGDKITPRLATVAYQREEELVNELAWESASEPPEYFRGILWLDTTLVTTTTTTTVEPTTTTTSTTTTTTTTAPPVTFDPLNKEASVTLSNGDLTATGTNNNDWESVVATEGRSSGKWYFELTFDVNINNPGYDISFGVVNDSFSTDTFVGADANGWGLIDNSSVGYFAGTPTEVLFSGGDPEIVAGDIIGIALDMDNGKIWWSLNGVWGDGGDPGAGTGEQASGLSGTLYPALTVYDTGTQATINFGATAFSYSIPSGFSAFQQ